MGGKFATCPAQRGIGTRVGKIFRPRRSKGISA